MKITLFEDCESVGCIGVRLAPIDVGFDVRGEGIEIRLPHDTTRASYADSTGTRYVVEGTCAEVARVLRAAGYAVSIESGGAL